MNERKKRNFDINTLTKEKKRNFDINILTKEKNEILSLIHWRKKRNEILILIYWSKKKIHRISFTLIDRFVRRIRNLHRDKNFNNTLNRVKNTLLRFKTRITIYRHWRFHDLTNKKFYNKEIIFAFFLKYAKNETIDKIYENKKLIEIKNVLRCKKCKKRRIWMIYE